MKNKRITYLDSVRITACILVVMVHIATQHIQDIPVSTGSFFVTLSLDCLALVGVPLFVMISGALTLRPEYSVNLKSVLIHKTLHFFLLYYIWKAFYQFYTLIISGEKVTLSLIKDTLFPEIIHGYAYYHLWFLPMLATLYMFLPLIKKGVEDNRSVCFYFICVFFVTALLFPTLFNYEFPLKNFFESFFEQNSFTMFEGYLGYFILGHYLHTWGQTFSRKKNIIIYLLGAAGYIVASILGFRASVALRHPSYIMNTPFAVPSFFMAIAIFMACQNIFSKKELSEKGSMLLKKLADTTFGIYLLHPFIINCMKAIGLDTDICTPIISIPLMLVCVFTVSMVLTGLLLKVPILRKLLQ
jgi:surface polysaccharide O-acyltransferase-like enzyme